MKTPALLALAALSLSACAANRAAPLAETGYAPGALAVAAIERGDWARAEALLTDASRGAADDPARLINLGKVYWETGRHEQARAAWRRAWPRTRPSRSRRWAAAPSPRSSSPARRSTPTTRGRRR